MVKYMGVVNFPPLCVNDGELPIPKRPTVATSSSKAMPSSGPGVSNIYPVFESSDVVLEASKDCMEMPRLSPSVSCGDDMKILCPLPVSNFLLRFLRHKQRQPIISISTTAPPPPAAASTMVLSLDEVSGGGAL